MVTRAHDLRGLSPTEAYDETQTNDEIKHGDVLLVDGAVGVLDAAWPCVVVGDHASYHCVMPTSTWDDIVQGCTTEEGKRKLQDGLLAAWAIACQ